MNEMTMLLQMDKITKAAARECAIAKKTWDSAEAIAGARKPRKPRAKRGFVRDSDITALLANGRSYDQISEVLNMTPSGIAKRVQSGGLREKAKMVERKKAYDAMIVSLLSQDFTEGEIAEALGLSRSGVAGRIQRNGLRDRAKEAKND